MTQHKHAMKTKKQANIKNKQMRQTKKTGDKQETTHEDKNKQERQPPSTNDNKQASKTNKRRRQTHQNKRDK